MAGASAAAGTPVVGADDRAAPIGRGVVGGVELKGDSAALGGDPALAIGARPTSSVFIGAGA